MDQISLDLAKNRQVQTIKQVTKTQSGKKKIDKILSTSYLDDA